MYAICQKIWLSSYNQSGVLKIEILILLRLARFQNLGTPPTKTPVESSKRNSVPSKLPGVAEGNSSPRPLSKLPVINSPSTKSGSGGGPSVAANSPAPMTRDKSTRGGSCGCVGVEIHPRNLFSEKQKLKINFFYSNPKSGYHFN